MYPAGNAQKPMRGTAARFTSSTRAPVTHQGRDRDLRLDEVDEPAIAAVAADASEPLAFGQWRAEQRGQYNG